MDSGILKKVTRSVFLKVLYFTSSAIMILPSCQADQLQQSTAQYTGNAEFGPQSNEISENISLDKRDLPGEFFHSNISFNSSSSLDDDEFKLILFKLILDKLIL